MDIDKLISEITNEVYNKVSADTAFTEKPKAASVSIKDIAPYADIMVMEPDVTEDELTKICDQAETLGVVSVCVNSSYVEFAAKKLHNTGVKVGALVGFPTGAASTMSKAAEALDAVQNGAKEIDVVINHGWVKSRQWKKVEEDVETVVRTVGERAKVHVIIGSRLLDAEQKVKAGVICKIAGADMVVASSIKNDLAATKDDIDLLGQCIGKNVGIKAAGVCCPDDAAALLDAGACRIGLRSSCVR